MLVKICDHLLFQFHNGTINTLKDLEPLQTFDRFNSTTVQLIHETEDAGHRRTKFQFHNGTINTMLVLDKELFKKCFNSTTVQLIPGGIGFQMTAQEASFNSTTVQLILPVRHHAHTRYPVSIPQRYN